MRLTLGSLLAFTLAGHAAVLEPRASTSATITSFPGPWVTIDTNGHVATVTPVHSGSTTLSAPPSVLTQHTAYILSLNGKATTTTASPPVASATGAGTAGAFMKCSGGQDAVTDSQAPFCQPRQGTQLTPNLTYYVTWDPSGFTSNETLVLEAEFGGNGAAAAGESGFATSALQAASGFYAWTIDSTFVSAHGSGSSHVNVTFSLVYNQSTIPDPDSEIRTVRLSGPSVLVTNNPQVPSKHHHHVSAVAIAVPVVVGAAVLVLLGFCVWSYRHHGHLPCIGGLVSRRTSSFSAKGYGVRQSYGQRTGGSQNTGTYGPGFGDSRNGRTAFYENNASPPTRGNAFRDELKRQESERR
ncbi:hypothetical protein SEUCBS140593_007007 [Sporothrix eucalyptigena]|uniref:Uncharacterized protein n=1 Tax=Sporothrix eucalyptigena TaxID=1812306 RepID=A0ABP0CB64_9PEZI